MKLVIITVKIKYESFENMCSIYLYIWEKILETVTLDLKWRIK